MSAESTAHETSSAPDPSAQPLDPGTATGSGPPAGSAVGEPALVARPSMGRHLALFAVVAGLILLDLWSKSTVFGWLVDPAAAASFDYAGTGHPRYAVAETKWLGFMLNLNYGAAFGQGSSAQGVLVGGRCVAALFLTFLIIRTPRGQRLYLASLVLILSGALGNLWDNLFYDPTPGLPGFVGERRFGPVRDFIDVYFYGWEWHFPTFNVADSCITVGAILLLLSGFVGGKADTPVAAPQA